MTAEDTVAEQSLALAVCTGAATKIEPDTEQGPATASATCGTQRNDTLKDLPVRADTREQRVDCVARRVISINPLFE
jgi:hypothetical protein